jgi:hypothetical protein
MKNILKYTVVLLSVLSFSFANAGELSVTGSAKASYVIVSSDSASGAQEQPKSLGVANEFNLGASGELENGMAWGYNINIDADTTQDDGGLWLSNGYGKVAFNISQGGLELSKAAAITATGDRAASNGYGENMFEGFSIGDMNNIAYSLPAGLLPFGITASVAYAPSTAADDNQSVNDLVAANAGTVTNPNAPAATAGVGSSSNNQGRTMTQYAVSAAPIAGLTVGASYDTFQTKGTLAQDPEGGAWYAKYALGNATLAYGKAYYALGINASSSDINTYETIENTTYGALIAVNDAMSVSYHVQKSNAMNVTNTTADVEMEATQIGAAYTVGGLTLALAMNSYDNASYISNKDVKSTVFNVSIAF